jgi:hypothetical protein
MYGSVMHRALNSDLAASDLYSGTGIGHPLPTFLPLPPFRIFLSPHSPQQWQQQASNKQSTIDRPTMYTAYSFLKLIIFCLHFVRGIDKY